VFDINIASGILRNVIEKITLAPSVVAGSALSVIGTVLLIVITARWRDYWSGYYSHANQIHSSLYGELVVLQTVAALMSVAGILMLMYRSLEK
jgi:hypothetical protein